MGWDQTGGCRPALPSIASGRRKLTDDRAFPPDRAEDNGVAGKGVPAGRLTTLLQNALELARNRAGAGLQARSVQFAAAERPRVGEEAFHDLQTRPSHFA
jgi:hypothetical protein